MANLRLLLACGMLAVNALGEEMKRLHGQAGDIAAASGRVGVAGAERKMYTWFTYTENAPGDVVSKQCSAKESSLSLNEMKTECEDPAFDPSKQRYVVSTSGSYQAIGGVQNCSYGYLFPNAFTNDITGHEFFTDIYPYYDYNGKIDPNCKVYDFYATKDTECSKSLGDSKVHIQTLYQDKENTKTIPYLPIDRRSLAIVHNCNGMHLYYMTTGGQLAKGLRTIPAGTRAYSENAALPTVGGLVLAALISASLLSVSSLF